MRSQEPLGTNLRQSIRLPRQPEHSWQLRLEDDRLITKNIINLSATGMAFKAPASSDIHLGQTLRFSLSIDEAGEDENRKFFECEGRVLWTKASADKPGSMHQIGVQFSKLPSSLDEALVRQVNAFSLRNQKEKVLKGKQPLTQKLVMSAPPSIRNFLMKVFGAVIIMSLTSAFLTALWMHKAIHPEQTVRTLSSSTDR